MDILPPAQRRLACASAIENPVVQAGMAFGAHALLAAAASNADGLGCAGPGRMTA